MTDQHRRSTVDLCMFCSVFLLKPSCVTACVGPVVAGRGAGLAGDVRGAGRDAAGGGAAGYLTAGRAATPLL